MFKADFYLVKLALFDSEIIVSQPKYLRNEILREKVDIVKVQYQ